MKGRMSVEERDLFWLECDEMNGRFKEGDLIEQLDEKLEMEIYGDPVTELSVAELSARADACEKHNPPLLSLARFLRPEADAFGHYEQEAKSRFKMPFEK